jgi:hypothetical protein
VKLGGGLKWAFENRLQRSVEAVNVTDCMEILESCSYCNLGSGIELALNRSFRPANHNFTSNHNLLMLQPVRP